MPLRVTSAEPLSTIAPPPTTVVVPRFVAPGPARVRVVPSTTSPPAGETSMLATLAGAPASVTGSLVLRLTASPGAGVPDGRQLAGLFHCPSPAALPQDLLAASAGAAMSAIATLTIPATTAANDHLNGTPPGRVPRPFEHIANVSAGVA